MYLKLNYIKWLHVCVGILFLIFIPTLLVHAYDSCSYTAPDGYSTNDNPVISENPAPADAPDAGQVRYVTSDSDGSWWFTPTELPNGCFLVNQDAKSVIGPCYPQVKANTYKDKFTPYDSYKDNIGWQVNVISTSTSVQYSISNLQIYHSTEANFSSPFPSDYPIGIIMVAPNQETAIFDVKIKPTNVPVSFKKRIGTPFTITTPEDPAFLVKNDLGKNGKVSVQSVSSNIIDQGNYYIVPPGTVSTIRIMAIFDRRLIPQGVYNNPRIISIDPIEAPGTPTKGILNVNVSSSTIMKGGSETVTWDVTNAYTNSFVNIMYNGTGYLDPIMIVQNVPANQKSYTFNAGLVGAHQIRITDTVDGTLMGASPTFNVINVATDVELYPVNGSLDATIRDGEKASIPLFSLRTPTTFAVKVIYIPTGEVVYKRTYTYSKYTGYGVPFVWQTKKGQVLGDYKFEVTRSDILPGLNVKASKPFHVVTDDAITSVSVASSTFEMKDIIAARWTTSSSTTKINVALYKSDVLVKKLASGITPLKGVVTYTIPRTLIPGADYFVKVTDVYYPTISSSSPLFEIKRPEILLNDIPGNVALGKSITLTWQGSTKIKVFSVKVINQTTNKVVTSKSVSALNKTFTWTVPLATPLGTYKFVVSDASDPKDVVQSNVFNVVSSLNVSQRFEQLWGNVWSSIMNLINK